MTMYEYVYYDKSMDGRFDIAGFREIQGKIIWKCKARNSYEADKLFEKETGANIVKLLPKVQKIQSIIWD